MEIVVKTNNFGGGSIKEIDDLNENSVAQTWW